MTEQHPAEDLLVELALDDIERSEREEILHHLSVCARCRDSYATVAGAIDRTLAAAPRIEPPPGFDGSVVAALGLDSACPGHVGGSPSTRRLHAVLRLAAAAIIGIVVGVGAAVGSDLIQQEPSATLTANSAVLRTGEGDVVGTVSASRVDGQPVVVVGVAEAVVGVEYRCRLLLADGRRVDAGTWTARTENGWTWVVRAPEDNGPENTVVALELVSTTGKVWSSAELTSG
ncbi:MAG: hypothetical protein ACRDSE_21305 [Pseudonocardiaceae bacterium]